VGHGNRKREIGKGKHGHGNRRRETGRPKILDYNREAM